MSSGHRNNFAKQMAEHLVCAELGRRGFVATPFAGNVPIFDVLTVSISGLAMPIQVKATRSNSWRSDARYWMDIEFQGDIETQKYLGFKTLSQPDLVYVCVALAAVATGELDRFFVLTASELQNVCVNSYKTWMDKQGWKRPRKPNSFDLRYKIGDIERFEDNWALIEETLSGR